MDGVRRSVTTSAMLALALTLLLTLGVSLAMPLIMRLMNISDVLYDDAYHYMLIVVLGLVAMMSYNLLSCICRALGDSRTPLYFLIVSSLLNIALALLFIVVFGWGVPGSAIALVIAQAVSAILCLCFMRRRFPMLRLTRADWAFDWPFAWQHLRLGLPMAVQFLIISMGILVLQSVCNTFGPETIAGFVSATKIEQLALQPMISFGIAMAVYSAQNYGASQYGRIRQGVRQCSLVSLAFCLVAAVAMYSYGRELISVFTTDHDEILMEQAFLYLKMSVPFISSWARFSSTATPCRAWVFPAYPSSAASWNWAAAAFRPWSWPPCGATSASAVPVPSAGSWPACSQAAPTSGSCTP